MLVDVDHSMKVMRDETFGPVVGVMKVRDAEEALRLANDSRYGLSGSVFGERGNAEQVARRVECGAVNVNDVLVNYFASDVPMGGWKESGIGYRHGDPGDQEVLPHRVAGDHPLRRQARTDLVPLHPRPPRPGRPHRRRLQRPRPEAPPRPASADARPRWPVRLTPSPGNAQKGTATPR